MDLSFPTWLYHRDAPEGRHFSTPADLPHDMEGWHDTPAKLDPNYQEPPPPAVDPARVPADAPGYVPQAFPAWRYHRATHEEKHVTSAEALADLDPAVWLDTPDAHAYDTRVAEDARKAELAVSAAPVAAPVSVTPAPSSPLPPAVAAVSGAGSLAALAAAASVAAAPAAPPAAPDAPASADALTGEKAAPKPVTLTDPTSLYAATVADIVTALEAVEDVEVVKRIGALERERPKGSRKSVASAIKARLAALAPAKAQVDE